MTILTIVQAMVALGCFNQPYDRSDIKSVACNVPVNSGYPKYLRRKADEIEKAINAIEKDEKRAMECPALQRQLIEKAKEGK